MSKPPLARVYVTPRADVRDPQGDAVRDALRALGFHEVEDVRVGRYLEVSLGLGASGEAPAARVQAMCDALLANPVVEDARFELVHVPANPEAQDAKRQDASDVAAGEGSR